MREEWARVGLASGGARDGCWIGLAWAGVGQVWRKGQRLLTWSGAEDVFLSVDLPGVETGSV